MTGRKYVYGCSRRDFLKSVGIAGAAVAFPAIIPSGVLAADGRPGANDRIGIAVIGPGRQGSGLLSSAGGSGFRGRKWIFDI